MEWGYNSIARFSENVLQINLATTFCTHDMNSHGLSPELVDSRRLATPNLVVQWWSDRLLVRWWRLIVHYSRHSNTHITTKVAAVIDGQNMGLPLLYMHSKALLAYRRETA